MSDEQTGEVQETEQDDQQHTDVEDPRVKKANQEAATYRRELRATQAELKKLREASQTEQEKALAEAEQRGQAAALSKVGHRLARAELRAAAAGTVDADTLDGFLEYADLSKFLDDQGEPNTKAIAEAVKRLGGGTRQTNFDGGARSTAAKPADMNQLIRQQAGLS
jgi:molecular chaperone GrpE (heat shock protein)